jgi:2-oxoglutarate ferredoxin oxidoreductase subunit beta
MEDYASEMPRWCKGCGDHGVLAAVQRTMRDHFVKPENVVAVSGIGCSSRLPHYLRTYGFHGIHGRALPIATGVRLSRPDLKVIVTMGDGDCFSIGGNHWLHALRYNLNAVVLVLDNGVYALTKMQASPTTPEGVKTRTTPHGGYLPPFNPLSVVAGINGVSFLAQTATWLPEHLDATIEKAWEHPGLAFVRVLQRCPVFMPDAFGDGGLHFPMAFLEDEWGIPVSSFLRKRGEVQAHDPRDLIAAQEIAAQLYPAPMGLLYQNTELPTYEEIRFSRRQKPTTAAFRQRLEGVLDQYAVGKPKNLPEVPVEPEIGVPDWVAHRPRKAERAAPNRKLHSREMEEQLARAREETREETINKLVTNLLQMNP